MFNIYRVFYILRASHDAPSTRHLPTSTHRPVLRFFVFSLDPPTFGFLLPVVPFYFCATHMPLATSDSNPTLKTQPPTTTNPARLTTGAAPAAFDPDPSPSFPFAPPAHSHHRSSPALGTLLR